MCSQAIYETMQKHMDLTIAVDLQKEQCRRRRISCSELTNTGRMAENGGLIGPKKVTMVI